MAYKVLLHLVLPFLISGLLAFLLLKILLYVKAGIGLGKGQLNQIRWSTQKVPTLGGMVILFAFLVGYLVSFVLGSAVNIHFLMSVLFAFGLGLYDDLRSISTRLKFLGQLLIAMGTAALGLGLHLFGPIPDFVLTVLLFVTLMNSINMLDNMDGVAGAVSVVFFLGITIIFTFLGSLGLISGLIVFLIFNHKPARIYLGDSGTLMLGYLMAFFSIQAFNSLLRESEFPLMDLIGLSSCLFCFPLADTILVVVNRLAAGISPATGGKDHSTHHLVYAGVREKYVPLLYAGIAMVGWSLAALFLSSASILSHGIFWVIALGYFFAVAVILWLISRSNMKHKKFTYSHG